MTEEDDVELTELLLTAEELEDDVLASFILFISISFMRRSMYNFMVLRSWAFTISLMVWADIFLMRFFSTFSIFTSGFLLFISRARAMFPCMRIMMRWLRFTFVPRMHLAVPGPIMTQAGTLTSELTEEELMTEEDELIDETELLEELEASSAATEEAIPRARAPTASVERNLFMKKLGKKTRIAYRSVSSSKIAFYEKYGDQP